MIADSKYNGNQAFTFVRKELLFLVFLWLLIYIEPIQLGSFKISQLWKGILVAYLLSEILKHIIPIYIWFGILFSVKYLVYAGMPYGYLDNFRLFIESLVFPVSLGYLYLRYRRNYKKPTNLMNYALLLSIFLIYSAAPFLFGLKSLYNDYDLLEKYNLNLVATKGLFYHIASASKMFTVATVMLMMHKRKFNHNKFYKLFWWVSILLGTFLIVMCWTRTGWFIYALSVFVLLFYQSSFKQKILGFSVVLFSFMAISYLYQSNEALRLRVTGGTSYRGEQELSFEQLASARLPYIIVAIENMKDEGGIGSFLGYGEQKGKDYFEKKTRMSITSHNSAFEIIESNGLLGLFLYICFIYHLFKAVRKRAKQLAPLDLKMVNLSILLFGMFFITSHGTPLWGELIYAFIFIHVFQKYELKRMTSLSNKDQKY